MSLLTEYMENFIYMNKTIAPDGYGGYVTTYTEGTTIRAAAVINTSNEMMVAEQQGVKALYTITTGREVNLQYHDVLKRARDSKIFRVTSDGDDNWAPKSGTLNMRNVTAEEWELAT